MTGEPPPPSLLGATPSLKGTEFRVWAPTAKTVEVVFETPPGKNLLLTPTPDGYFSGRDPVARGGDLYRYRLDNKTPFPDPASRFQPQGVHGPSQIVDPSTFPWTDASWRGLPWDRTVFYEVHVGTFSPDGTFDGVRHRLSYLKDLGITAIELMPVADFPGQRNWGYDGVNLFAPARCYGTPDDLRRLVNEAHGMGLAVYLDVVYNHLGPDGNYLGAFSPYYFTDRHQSAWGAGVNLDGDHSAPVRRFFIENAQRWIREYHFDGLRLDATHALMDDGPVHFLSELSAAIPKQAPDRAVHLVAEDHRNLNLMVRPRAEKGWGLDAVWADDFHHQIRVALAGDRDGYFADFGGTLADIANTVRQGWFFTGQVSTHLKGPRGTEPVSPEKCVACLQNHDQVGNRALGDRLHHTLDASSYRAATALLLTAPETPLLFMGQEWGARSPFLYFTDHNEELGRLVTQGRREEFKSFRAFADPAVRSHIPDPQSIATFDLSRLLWDEQTEPPAAGLLKYYRALLSFRNSFIGSVPPSDLRVETPAEMTLVLRRPTTVVAVRLQGSGSVKIEVGASAWAVAFTSEDSDFVSDTQPPTITREAGFVTLDFKRPGAVIWKIP